MNDKVLTDDEKNALLEGVESGEVEVHSSDGPSYASVTPFRIPPRAHIVSGSYPRLQVLNKQIAERLCKDVEQLLQCDVSVACNHTTVTVFGGLCEQLSGLAAVAVFAAPPLTGKAAIVMPPDMVRMLVDTFFGGIPNAAETPPRSTFTAGEIIVSNLFTDVVLAATASTWAPLQEIAAERTATEISIDLIDIATESDPVIATEFEVSFPEQQCRFHVLWPVDTVHPLLPLFEGQKGDRDKAEDARWASVLRRRVADSVVNLTSCVGHARMTLGELAGLVPGDVIDIEGPQDATVMASNVRLIHGRLGVHRGRNAVETIEWIDPLRADLANTGI